MSKRMPIQLPAQQGPALWRSLDEKRDSARRERAAIEEPSVTPKPDVAPKALLGRRGFLMTSGATAAAVGAAGCLRRPVEHILPYSQAPEYTLPGIELHYATSVSHDGEAIGLLVESHEGRPTKIEGNPEHPASLGASDARLQARILDLYDPDRSAHPLRRADENTREPSTWADFDAWWRERVPQLGDGRGLRVLVEPTDGPSFRRARAAFEQRFPSARVHYWSPVHDGEAREGARIAFGQPNAVHVDYTRARTILSVDCDFLGSEPGSIEAARRFAEGRRLRAAPPRAAEGQPPRDSAQDMNRLYVVEGGLSVTGMNADHRLRLGPSRAGAYLRALARKLSTMDGIELAPDVVAALGEASTDGIPEAWIDAVAADLGTRRGQGAVVVGSGQPRAVHALAHAINAGLGNLDRTVSLYAPVDLDQPSPTESIRSLAEDIREGRVQTLFILGGNPAFDAPAELGFGRLLESVESVVHLSHYDDETSALATWHLPRTHELESWGDHQSRAGTVSIQQPLIAPLRGGRSEVELFAMVAGIRGWRAYHLVRNTLRERVGTANLDRVWRRSLHAGVVVGLPSSRRLSGLVRGAEVGRALAELAAPGEGWDVAFAPSYQIRDGRQANNPWLLEMPDPVTKLVWDNAAIISPTSASELGVRTGDMLRLSREGVDALEVPALVLPAAADRVVTLPLGFGRSRAGRHGTGVGFDVYPFRSSDTLGFAGGVSVQRGSGRYDLVQTQEHHNMMGRPLSVDATLDEYRERADFPQWPVEGERMGEPELSVGPLWEEVDYTTPQQPAQGGTSFSLVPNPRQRPEGAPARHRWGLVIDLTTCTGCSACVVACQAENNVAVVGKAQVAIGREMHWMRLDRYFLGDDEGNPRVALQPVQCQHCENAPCENVCPVNATAHSPEGLNDMAYNRCIGTRYCMNNCPYKVRRFNFLDWHGSVPELQRMVFNPNVTVRMRGVMEKCTFCVQRIQAGRIRSRNADRPLRAEDVTPACAQACPSGALTFGDLNDESSEVARLAGVDRRYKLLALIGTQPRITFLGKIRNPNPEMV